MFDIDYKKECLDQLNQIKYHLENNKQLKPEQYKGLRDFLIVGKNELLNALDME